ncbi:MAG: GTP cyclohydrolase I FolE [Candidatus Omnitrophica bacterium]|nr:GTP cyclohydrolase I FolE [Candidatus Omnitrophota bacterium]
MDKERIKKAVREILEAVGENPEREGLQNTPERVANMYEEILGSTNKEGADEIKVFLEEEHDEIILLKDIPLYSMCEHHMVPFVGKAYVAYIPDGNRITGLSKIARVVDAFCKRLQVQERLTTQIADAMMKKLSPKGVLVVIEAEHLCMSMRGVSKPGIITTTSAVRGVFRSSQKTREEALSLIRHRRP